MRVFQPKYGRNTESCCYIIFSYCQHYIIHPVIYCNAKFALQVYKKKRMNIARFVSLPSTETAIVKRFGKTRQRKSAFRFDLHEQALGGMSLSVHVFAGLSFLRSMIRSCFMSVFNENKQISIMSKFKKEISSENI